MEWKTEISLKIRDRIQGQSPISQYSLYPHLFGNGKLFIWVCSLHTDGITPYQCPKEHFTSIFLKQQLIFSCPQVNLDSKNLKEKKIYKLQRF